MSESPVELRPGWSIPKPDLTPRPTFWPAATALGVMLFGWGLLTSLIIFLIGVAVLATSLTGWIGEIRHERKHAP
jgi:fatty acid desaturase